MFGKIISLVPSLTELLIDLGLKDQMAGRTRFCIHPGEQLKDIPIIGGTKNPRIDKIRSIQPDLIIANKEENRREDIEILARDFEVELTDITTIEDATNTIEHLGKKLSVESKAAEIITAIETNLRQRPNSSPIRTIYFIWREPWMTVGGDTYINDVMNYWHLENVFKDVTRYPVLRIGEIKDYKPELILLSSEPYPFKEKHIKMVNEICTNVPVLLVDGEWFSWYGSRMVHAFSELNKWRMALDEKVLNSH